MLDRLFFYLFAALTLGGALLTVTQRSAVRCAVALVASLLGVAGLFLLAGAEFLFAAQIILYVGGVVVLFLFVVMLVDLDAAARQRQFRRGWPIALGCVAGICLEAAILVWRGEPSLPPAASAGLNAAGNTEALGDTLFRGYLVPLEASSLLLLAAVVGAILMARGRES